MGKKGKSHVSVAGEQRYLLRKASSRTTQNDVEDILRKIFSGERNEKAKDGEDHIYILLFSESSIYC